MRWSRRNVLITPLVLLGAPVQLGARAMRWLLQWFDAALLLLQEAMPRWEE